MLLPKHPAPSVRVQSLTKIYQEGASQRAVLSNVDISFEAGQFTKLGDTFRAEGYLNIKDVRLPVLFDFSVNLDSDNIKLNGSTKIDRLLFNIGTGDPVPKSVTFIVPLTFIPACLNWMKSRCLGVQSQRSMGVPGSSPS